MNEHNKHLESIQANGWITGGQQEVRTTDGGPGSGNFGHSGRPGEVGGSGGGNTTKKSSEKKSSSNSSNGVKKNISAYIGGGEKGVNSSLSNYIFDNENGYAGSKKTFMDVINSQPFDGKKICEALNNTKNVIRKFSVRSETPDKIILNADDWIGNRDTIKITK